MLSPGSTCDLLRKPVPGALAAPCPNASVGLQGTLLLSAGPALVFRVGQYASEASVEVESCHVRSRVLDTSPGFCADVETHVLNRFAHIKKVNSLSHFEPERYACSGSDSQIFLKYYSYLSVLNV